MNYVCRQQAFSGTPMLSLTGGGTTMAFQSGEALPDLSGIKQAWDSCMSHEYSKGLRENDWQRGR